MRLIYLSNVVFDIPNNLWVIYTGSCEVSQFYEKSMCKNTGPTGVRLAEIDVSTTKH